jgi:hypothetical protein
MDEAQFRKFLKRGGRSASVIERCVCLTREFESYLQLESSGRDLGSATAADLEAFVDQVEGKPKTSAKTHLWALAYYYEFTANAEMRSAAKSLRAMRIQRTPFSLSGFRDVNPKEIKALAAAGIRNIDQMLKAGASQDGRLRLSQETGLPLSSICDLVELSDLARIPGMKGIRARLYHDAGVRSARELAACDPGELRELLCRYVQETGFDGIAPLPKEVTFSIDYAKKLPPLVQ